jgi:PKD repeat protein
MKKTIFAFIIFISIISCEKKVKDIEPLFKFATLGEGKMQFTNDATNATSFEWNFGDGTTSIEENPLHQYAKNGKYTVILIAKNKRNQVTKIYEVTVNDAPKPIVKYNYKSLGNGTIQFTNESQNAESFEWNFGNGATSKEINPKNSYLVNGTYEVKLTANNSNGSTELKQNVTIADAPKPIANFNFSYGSNGSVSFTNTSQNAESFLWSFGEGSTSDAKDVSKGYQKNGTYSVVLTAKNKNGESTATKTVDISNIYIAPQPTTGNVAFFLDFNSSSVEVTVNGTYRGLITKYYTSGTPDCFGDGTVTVTLPQGAYTYTAKQTSLFGSSWSGIVNVVNGSCRTYRLTK